MKLRVGGGKGVSRYDQKNSHELKFNLIKAGKNKSSVKHPKTI